MFNTFFTPIMSIRSHPHHHIHSKTRVSNEKNWKLLQTIFILTTDCGVMCFEARKSFLWDFSFMKFHFKTQTMKALISYEFASVILFDRRMLAVKNFFSSFFCREASNLFKRCKRQARDDEKKEKFRSGELKKVSTQKNV